MHRSWIGSSIALMLLCISSEASGQDYPARPVTLVVPFNAGGGTDIIGRAFAQELAAQLGKPVVVDNRSGAGTVIGTEYVSRAKPDGYTILVNGSTLTFHPAMLKKPPYDVARDLKPVTLISEQPYVLVVSSSFPANSLAELVALARAAPDTITYASAGAGSAMHLAAELLWQKLGIELVHIPYRGTGPATTDVISGEVKVMYTTAAGASGMLAAGKLKALAVSSAERAPTLPDVPTVAESGLPGYEHASWTALFVPSATPAEIVDKLHRASMKGLAGSGLREKFAVQGLEVRTSSTAEAGQFVREEIDRWTAVIKAAGIQPQ